MKESIKYCFDIHVQVTLFFTVLYDHNVAFQAWFSDIPGQDALNYITP